MSYMNNDEYLRFSRTEEYQTNLKNANFDLTKILKDQNNDATGYDDLWGAGIVMNWTKVPLEEQRCHINWRQSINDDGIALSSTLLASWMEQIGSVNGGTIGGVSLNNTNNNIQQSNIYEENQKDMSKEDNKNNEDYGEYIQKGIEFAKDKREKGEHLMSSDHETVKKLLGSATDLDAFAVIAATIALDKETDYTGVIDTYRRYATSLQTNNPVLIWTAVGGSEEIVKAYLNGTLDSDGTIVASSAVTSKKTGIPEPVIEETHLSVNDLGSLGTPYRITIHHLGGGFDHSASDINGYADNGIEYHYVIRWNGTIERGRPENMLGYHTWHNNSGNIGICVSGTWDDDPKDQYGKSVSNGGHPNPSEAQINSLISLIADRCRYHGIQPTRENIRGHAEWPNGGYAGYIGVTEGCPGSNLLNKLDSIVQAVASGSLSQTVKLWTQFAAAIIKGMQNKGTATGDLSLFPKICFLYVALEASAATTVSESFDTAEWGFPFADEDIRKYGNGTMTVTDLYGTPRNYGGHSGVDLQPAGMSLPEGHSGYRASQVPVRAMNDGQVIEAINDLSGTNELTIVHSGNRMSRYKHCYNHAVKEGDTVSRGQIISYVSGVGGGSVDAYPFHLHVEIGTGTNLQNYQHDNPMKYWKGADNTDNGGYDRARFTLSS